MFPDAFYTNGPSTVVIGDLDAFVAYVESGQALQAWWVLRAEADVSREAFLRSQSEAWRHIVYHLSPVQS